jgi:hypothetical protein
LSVGMGSAEDVILFIFLELIPPRIIPHLSFCCATT